MRKILIIENGKPTTLNETEFREEGKLQDYLEEYPNVIPLSEIVEGASDLLCIGREVSAGTGVADLFFIDKDGLLTIVETKLRKNREVRREVVGQILEYASYASQWNADEVYEIANEYFLKSDKAPPKTRGKTLDNIMQEIIGDDFSDEEFKSKVAQNLRDGRIRLIIAVDKLIEPLRATVTFLNSYSNFDILVLQVSSFEESESKKALVPSLFGYATKTTGTVRTVRRWDEISFFEDAKQRCEPKVFDMLNKLYEFAKSNGSISWGSGINYGSFTFRKTRGGIPVSVFTFNSTGWGNACFGELVGKGVSVKVVQSFRASLNQIPGFDIPEEAVILGKFPSISPETLTDPRSLNEFKQIVLTLCQQLEL